MVDLVLLLAGKEVIQHVLVVLLAGGDENAAGLAFVGPAFFNFFHFENELVEFRWHLL